MLIRVGIGTGGCSKGKGECWNDRALDVILGSVVWSEALSRIIASGSILRGRGREGHRQ